MLKSLSVWSYVLDILAVAVALIIGLVRKNKELRPVLLFVISSLIFDIVPFFFVHNQGGRTLHNEMFNISVVIELTILYYYYQTLLERPAFLYCLYTLYAIFSGLILYLWLGPMHTFKVFWVTLYGVENLFLTIPCFLYFYQLFRSDDAMDLKSNPHFFVVSGIIFFTAPLSRFISAII